MRDPIVSVVMASYNARRFLPDALASVFAQSYASWEIIVIDDGSTDGTEEIMQAYEGKVIYLRQPNRGPSAARNRGIEIARGRYLAFLDADDLWTPDKLRLQIDFMERHRDVGLVFADMEEFEGERILCPSLLSRSLFAREMVSGQPIPDAERKLFVEDYIPTSTVLIRKECFLRAGFFDETLQFVEDRDLWLRVAGLFPIGVVRAIVGRKRVHAANLTKKSAEQTLRARIRVWEKGRRFVTEPDTARMLDSLLADAYLELGYNLLTNDRRRDAFHYGLASILYAAKNALGNTAPRPLGGYRWGWALALIPLTLIRWSTSKKIWRVIHHAA
jgi:glycosyltransferase involved in cell wall biosynthesis